MTLFDNEKEYLAALGPIKLDEPGEGIYKTASATSSPASAARQPDTMLTSHAKMIHTYGYINDPDIWRNKSTSDFEYVYDGTYVTNYWVGYGSWVHNEWWTYPQWSINTGPNFYPPSLPTTSALGKVNTSFLDDWDNYNWLSLRSRGTGYGSGWAGFDYTIDPALAPPNGGYYLSGNWSVETLY